MNFLHVEEHHYGEVLADKLFEILEEYEICEKLFCITADNAGNNGTMCIALSTLLENGGQKKTATVRMMKKKTRF